MKTECFRTECRLEGAKIDGGVTERTFKSSSFVCGVSKSLEIPCKLDDIYCMHVYTVLWCGQQPGSRHLMALEYSTYEARMGLT